MRSQTRLFVTDPYALCAPHNGAPFTARIFGVPTVTVTDADRAVSALTRQARHFSGRVGNRVVAERLFGNSVLYQDGDEHSRLRRALRPLFQAAARPDAANGILHDYAHAAASQAKPLRALDFLRAVTVAVTLSRFMNIRPSFEEALWLSTQVDDLGMGLYASNPSDSPRSRFSRGLAARRHLLAFLDSHSSALVRSDLACLDLSERDVLSQGLTLLFAGVDTISATLTWALGDLLLRTSAETPGVTEAQASEAFDRALAAYPPTYFIPRGALADVELGGVHVRRGWNVNIMVSELHRHFLKTGHRESFMPFGLGSKRCPAMQYSYLLGPRLLRTLVIEFDVYLSPWTDKHLRFIPGLRPAASPHLRLAPCAAVQR